MPIEGIMDRSFRLLEQLTLPFVSKTNDLTKALPLKPGEWLHYGLYNADHFGKPTPDYGPADLWYHPSFFLVLLLGWLLLQAALRG